MLALCAFCLDSARVVSGASNPVVLVVAPVSLPPERRADAPSTPLPQEPRSAVEFISYGPPWPFVKGLGVLQHAQTQCGRRPSPGSLL